VYKIETNSHRRFAWSVQARLERARFFSFYTGRFKRLFFGISS